MTHLVSVDVETSGLDPYTHELIEVGMVWKSPDDGTYNEVDFSLPFNHHRADPKALEINGWDKQGAREKFPEQVSVEFGCDILRNVLDDAHIVGKNPFFDRSFLDMFFRLHSQARPEWHHRMVDVGNVLMGRFRSRTVPNTEAVERATGIAIPESLRHTALGDAVWAWDVLHYLTEPDR